MEKEKGSERAVWYDSSLENRLVVKDESGEESKYFKGKDGDWWPKTPAKVPNFFIHWDSIEMQLSKYVENWQSPGFHIKRGRFMKSDTYSSDWTDNLHALTSIPGDRYYLTSSENIHRRLQHPVGYLSWAKTWPTREKTTQPKWKTPSLNLFLQWQILSKIYNTKS